MMQDDGTPGTVRVYGCAAEETEGAKVFMARDNLFADLDAALAWHSAPFAGAGNVRLNAFDQVRIVFRGRTAHAGNAPWEGRSALKAAEMFGIGVQMMREHLLPTARVHYIYEAAGVAPNVIPEHRAGLDRHPRRGPRQGRRDDRLDEGGRRRRGARHPDRGRVPPLLRRPRPHAERAPRAAAPPPHPRGPDRFHRRGAGLRQGLPARDGRARGRPRADPLPFLEEVSAGASSDLGDVSYQVPTGVFGWPTFPLHIGLHTWPVTACGGMSIGDKASLKTAQILAACGYDLMTDPDLRAAARQDFRRRTGDAPFVSPLPPDRKPPLGLDPRFIKTGDDEILFLRKQPLSLPAAHRRQPSRSPPPRPAPGTRPRKGSGPTAGGREAAAPGAVGRGAVGSSALLSGGVVACTQDAEQAIENEM